MWFKSKKSKDDPLFKDTCSEESNDCLSKARKLNEEHRLKEKKAEEEIEVKCKHVESLLTIGEAIEYLGNKMYVSRINSFESVWSAKPYPCGSFMLYKVPGVLLEWLDVDKHKQTTFVPYDSLDMIKR